MCSFKVMAGASGTRAAAMAVVENIRVGVKASGSSEQQEKSCWGEGERR